ncbi:hypothetical protein AB834_01040 [PVC group bacterium (ex Bugula neritina AB1)]|nr:hypothetical protein AB834_01040 [PVC group bacterium (ex Bugula neritina AB1)]
MYTKKYTVRLHDTDAFGVLYFANQFRIIHEAYEEFTDDLGFHLNKLMDQSQYFIPIVHAEASYNHPVMMGDTLKISLNVENISVHSYSITYDILLKKILVGTAKTVHVSTHAYKNKKVPIPKSLRQALEKHL